jgi:hypothetical protein
MVKVPDRTRSDATDTIRDALSFGLIEEARGLIIEELYAKHPPAFVALLLQYLVLKKPVGKPKEEKVDAKVRDAWRKWDVIGSQYAVMQFDKVHQFRQKLAQKYNCNAKTIDSIFKYYKKICDGLP